MQQLTSRIVRLISKILILSFWMVSTGCLHRASTPQISEEAVPSTQKIVFASFDQVWRAAHAVLRYTIANENPDTGLIETEYIKGVEGWLAPDQKRSPSAGLRYKITMILAKGNTEGRPSTRIRIEKRIEVLKDFFSKPEIIESDGLEEAVILYRIERELIISEALKKAG